MHAISSSIIVFGDSILVAFDATPMGPKTVVGGVMIALAGLCWLADMTRGDTAAKK